MAYPKVPFRGLSSQIFSKFRVFYHEKVVKIVVKTFSVPLSFSPEKTPSDNNT